MIRGDVYLIYRCPHCDSRHVHLVAPLDDDLVACTLALGVAWCYERAEGASEISILISLVADGTPHAIALRRDGDTLTGTTIRLEREHARKLNAQEAFAHTAREGRPLPHERADDEGIKKMFRHTMRGAATAQLSLERLLAEVDVSGLQEDK